MIEKVLITGATGLVGTHLLYWYRKKPRVHVTALYHTDIPEHLKELSKEDWVDFIKANLFKEGYAFDVLESYDTIIHAATYGQPNKFIADKTGTILLNTYVTEYLLGDCLQTHGRFLFLSTSEVYNGAIPPYEENTMGTTTPSHPRAVYIEGKRCGETIVNIYRERGANAKSVRLSLAYGEGTRKNDGRALNRFIQKGLQNSEIRLMDKGEALRTYIYAEDAVEMMMNVLYRGKYEVYNIGGDSTVTIAELANMIGKETGKPVVLGHGTGAEGAPQDTKMSIQRYIDEFGQPEFTPLEEGLKRTIEFQKKLYAANISKDRK